MKLLVMPLVYLFASLSSDGTILAIGAYNNDGSFSNAGHVRVYEFPN